MKPHVHIDETELTIARLEKERDELRADLAWYKEQNTLLWDHVRRLEQSQHDLRQNKKNYP